MSESVLIINPSRSECSACGHNADPAETTHRMEHMIGEGCGATYTGVTTTYADFSGLYARIHAMRPDLPPVGLMTPLTPEQPPADHGDGSGAGGRSGGEGA